MSPRSVGVIGAGVAGLAAAIELSSSGSVTVYDRLPVAGGVLGYEDPLVGDLARRCHDAGVRWMLGTTTVRWARPRLLTVGPAGIRWVEHTHLIYAGGTRPATQAELGIAGPRLAGVLPATVALHFAEAKVLLGHQIVFVGTGDWAHAAARVIAEHPCQITVVASDGAATPEFRHEALWSGWTPVSVAGAGRVSSLTLERDGVERSLSCDAVVLADRPRPLRNVDGAVLDPSEGVAFVQGVHERISARSAVAEAQAAARSSFSEPRVEVFA